MIWPFNKKPDVVLKINGKDVDLNDLGKKDSGSRNWDRLIGKPLIYIGMVCIAATLIIHSIGGLT